MVMVEGGKWQAASSFVVEYLNFTTEDCEDYTNNKLPTLDCEIWVENYKIK